MTKQTFMIARTGMEKREVAFVDSFDLFGHAWCVHERIDGIGYGVSHLETGFRVPKSEAVRPEESRHRAIEYLTAKQDQIESVLAQVRAM